MRFQVILASAISAALAFSMPALGQQRIQFPTPASSGLRPVGTLVQNTTGNTAPLGTSGGPVMVPLNSPSPSYTPSVPQFDPYSARQVTTPSFPQSNPFAGAGSVPPSLGAPSLGAPVGQPGTFGNPPNFGAPPSYGAPTFGGPPNFGAPLNSGYPGYNGASPSLPGAGQSGILGSSPYANNPSVYPPSAFPNSSPSALFPGVYPQGGYGYGPGGYGQSGLGSWFGNLFGNGGAAYGQPGYGQPGTLSPPGGLVLPPGGAYGNWNPQGSVFNGSPAYPQVLRLFQGPRFRHAWIYGSKDDDALEINDSDVALAFAFPNFLYSTQPVYILPSFSIHQWDGPRGGVADLPAIAYSAFVDAGWQSDPARIMGAELGGRVGWFSDFSANTTDSLRFMGRALGRVRLTPAATLKLGVIYLDRNKVKLLPAGGLLWQPNPETRFDLFFPEPKLAHYVATVGTMDTWWYVGGYYGGGSWTVERTSGASESIDINDIRLLLGLEWGRNDQMRDGRRVGFLEVGYVFQRELLYKQSPADNLDLQDSIMVRAGFGY